MPGLHSPEKLAQRRARAWARGFIQSKHVLPPASLSGDSLNREVGAAEFVSKSTDHEVVKIDDAVFFSDPWAAADSRISMPTQSYDNPQSFKFDLWAKYSPSVLPPPRPCLDDVAPGRLLQAGSSSASLGIHDSDMVAIMQRLIDAQNATISYLNGLVDAYKLTIENWSSEFTASSWCYPQSNVSCEPVKTQAEVANMKENLLSLAEPLPPAVETALDKRAANFVSCERFQNLENLVKDVACNLACELESSTKDMRGELSAFKTLCAESFTTIVKKQVQQDEDIKEFQQRFTSVPDTTATAMSSDLSLTCSVEEDIASTSYQRGANIEYCSRLTLAEFLAMSEAVKRRLPFIPEVPKPLLMLCDAPQILSFDTCSDATSELPTDDERDFAVFDRQH